MNRQSLNFEDALSLVEEGTPTDNKILIKTK